MPIQPTVALGSTVEGDCFFYNDDGQTPLQTIGGVIFNVYAPNNLKVLSGIAAQDFANPAHWVAIIAIPDNAPITQPGQFYTLQWIANTSTGKDRQTQQFTVTTANLPDPVDAVTIALQNMPFEIDLVLPYSTVSTLSLRIIDSNENVIAAYTNLAGTVPVTQNGVEYVYRMPVTDTAVLNAIAISNPTPITVQTALGPNGQLYPWNNTGYTYGSTNGILAYIAYINYTLTDGTQNTEVQPIYIVTTLMLQMMRAMQNFVDILRNNDTIPQLRVSESKLVEFLIQGLIRFNSENPQYIQYGFGNLPQQFIFLVQKAASYELLQALYLGEGMTSFNFGGMSTSLDSDRTQYIATLMDSLRSDLANITIVKKNFAKSGGGTGRIGSIGTTYGPNFNFVFPSGSFIGGMNSYGLPYLY